MFQDLRYGVRVLFKSRMLTLVAVLSLGLGIGVTSTIYALLDQLLIHDVTAREPERLVSLDGSWCSYPNYRDIRDSGVFAELAANAMCYPEPLWRERDQTHPIFAACVSGNFFEVMGVQAARGRVFTHDEAAAEKNPRVVVISHQFWQQRLGSDPNVIGRLFTINRTGYTIIGVLPAGYRGKYGRPPEVVVPFSTDLYPRLFERDSATMGYTGRLAPGRTIAQTQQALLAVLRGLERQFPDKIKLKQEPVPELKPAVGMAKFGKKSWDFKFSAMLGAIAVLVLLIACANVTGLLLAEASHGSARSPPGWLSARRNCDSSGNCWSRLRWLPGRGRRRESAPLSWRRTSCERFRSGARRFILSSRPTGVSRLRRRRLA
jgi:MacB-like periplasmic core domain